MNDQEAIALISNIEAHFGKKYLDIHRAEIFRILTRSKPETAAAIAARATSGEFLPSLKRWEAVRAEIGRTREKAPQRPSERADPEVARFYVRTATALSRANLASRGALLAAYRSSNKVGPPHEDPRFEAELVRVEAENVARSQTPKPASAPALEPETAARNAAFTTALAGALRRPAKALETPRERTRKPLDDLEF